MRWATTSGKKDETKVGRSVEENGCMAAREGLKGIYFKRILSTVHASQGNSAVYSITTELPRKSPLLYSSRLFRESGMTRKRVQGK